MSKVDTVVNNIQQRSQNDGFLGTSRNSHLQQSLQDLKNLSPAERNEAIGKLSDADLQAFADDVNSSGIGSASGLSADEKKDLFNELAKGLNGEQLGRLATQFDSTSDMQLMAKAVADHASPDAKLGFIQSIAPQATERDAESYTGTYGAHTGANDKQAEAIMEVLGSFENGAPQFDSAIQSLNKDQWNAVLGAGIDTKQYAYAGHATDDPAQLNKIIEAASHSGNIDVKTSVFVSTTERLQNMDPTASKSVTDQLIKLMDSDTRGIVQALRTQDTYGKALKTYAQEVLRHDPSAENPALGRQLAQMQGAGVSETAEAYFYETAPGDNNEPYPVNAANLGYFVGAVRAGLDGMKADAQKQRSQMSSILNTAISVGTTATSAGATTTVFTTLTSAIVSETLNQVSDNNLDTLGQEFQKMAMPEGASGNSDAAEAFMANVHNVRLQ